MLLSKFLLAGTIAKLITSSSNNFVTVGKKFTIKFTGVVGYSFLNLLKIGGIKYVPIKFVVPKRTS